MIPVFEIFTQAQAIPYTNTETKETERLVYIHGIFSILPQKAEETKMVEPK